MRTATLTRKASDDQGTDGKIEADTGFFCASGEEPDRDNAPDISCFPKGKYMARWYASGRPSMAGKSCYHVDDVPGRFGIEIHAANFYGDASKGWIKQVEGCIALGMEIAVFAAGTNYGHSHPLLVNPQRGLVSTQEAVAAFERAMRNDAGEQEDFELTVQ